MGTITALISNKQRTTLLPIICERVLVGSIIHSDELKSYLTLVSIGYVYKRYAISIISLIV